MQIYCSFSAQKGRFICIFAEKVVSLPKIWQKAFRIDAFNNTEIRTIEIQSGQF